MAYQWNMNMSVNENALAATLQEIDRLQRKPPSPKRDARLAAALKDRETLAAKVRAERGNL